MTAIDKKKVFSGAFFSMNTAQTSPPSTSWTHTLSSHYSARMYLHNTFKETVSNTTPPLNIPALTRTHTHTHTVDRGLPSEWVPFTLLLVPCGYCVCLWQSLFLPLISAFPACPVFSLNPWTVQYVLSYGRVKTNNNDDRIFILTGNQMWLYTRVHYMVFMLLWRSSALKSLKVQINSDYKWTCFLFGCT